jgi:type I restriction enzyme S subunit
VLRAKEAFDQDAVFYNLEHKDIQSFIVGGTRSKLNQSALRAITIYLPNSKPEQTKIAEILSTVDQVIEQTEALIAKQQRIKTGLMQDLLTRGIDKHGNLRSEQTNQFKDSPLGRIPVEWEVWPSSLLCREIIVGIVIRPAQYYRPDGVPVLRSANVRENSITSEDLVFMSEKDNETLSKSCLRKGDMVTVRTGYPGTTAVIPPELDGSNCVDIVISRPAHEKVKSEFLSIWVNSDQGKKQVLEGQGGLAQQRFNIGEMRALLVKVSDISEQERIANLLILQNSAIEDLVKNQHKLRSLKTALMQDLLTGKKRVTSLLDAREVATL